MKTEHSALLDAVAHGGNPQDRAASLFPFPLNLMRSGILKD
jgi:hypothetical protein